MGILIMPDSLIDMRFHSTEDLILFAGANGSGKTTLWNKLNLNIEDYINPDDIKIDLERQFGHEVNQLVASKHAASKMLALFKKRASFAWETTFDAKNPLSILLTPKAYNYNVSMIYVAPLSVEDCIKNVRKRAENNGHNVPEDTIRTRYEKSIKNFCEICSLIDWYLYLNDNNTHKLVALSATGVIKLVKPELIQFLPQQLQGIFAGVCH